MAVKYPQMIRKIIKVIKIWVEQLSSTIKNDKNKNDKEEENQKFENNQFFGFQPRQQKMNKSLGDTRYFDENKMYAKNNQYNVTSDKDNMSYIDSASDRVGIGGDEWVIE